MLGEAALMAVFGDILEEIAIARCQAESQSIWDVQKTIPLARCPDRHGVIAILQTPSLQQTATKYGENGWKKSELTGTLYCSKTKCFDRNSA